MNLPWKWASPYANWAPPIFIFHGAHVNEHLGFGTGTYKELSETTAASEPYEASSYQVKRGLYI
jgi:hypothetical protein